MKTHSLFATVLVWLLLIAPAQAIETVRTPITPENADQITMTTLLGRGAVYDMAWSPDEKTLAITGPNGIWLYDAQDWAKTPVLLGNEFHLAEKGFFDSTGQFFVTRESGGWSRWDMATNTRLLSVSLPEDIHVVDALAMSPDGRYVVASGIYGVYHEGDADTTYWTALMVWETESGHQISRTDIEVAYISTLNFSPDGKMLIAGPGFEGPLVYRFEDLLEQDSPDPVVLDYYEALPSLVTIAYGPDGDVYALYQSRQAATQPIDFEFRNVSRDTTLVTITKPKWYDITISDYNLASHLLAVSGQIGTIEVYDVATGSLVKTLMGADTTSRLAFSPSGKTIVAYTDERHLMAWDMDTGTGTLITDAHTQFGYKVRFHPDSERLAFGTQLNEGDVQLWDIDNAQILMTIPGAGGWVSSLSFNPDGTLLSLSGGIGCCPHVWDIESGNEVAVLYGHENSNFKGVDFVSFVGDGTRLLSGGKDGTARLWDISSQQDLMAFQHAAPGIGIKVAGMVAEGRQVLTFAGDGEATLALWNAETERSLELPFSQSTSELIFSRDETRFATRTLDTVSVYDSATLALISQIRVPEETRQMVFSPDNSMLAALTSAGDFALYDLSTGEALTEQHVVDWSLFDIDWSADGTRIALTGREGSVFVYEIGDE